MSNESNVPILPETARIARKWRKLSRKNPELIPVNTGSKKNSLIPIIGSFKSAVDRVIMKAKIASHFASVSNVDHHGTLKSIFHIRKPDRRTGVTVFQNIEDDENGNIFRDLPPMTDEEVVDFTSTELVGGLINSKQFRFLIMFFIAVNSVCIALETDKKLEREYAHIFKVLDQCIMTIFVCEIGLKWYHGFIKFWKSGWDILDFLIVGSLLVGPYVIETGGGGRGVIRILRVLRAFRSLRSIHSLPGLQVVVQTILQSVPDMTNIVLLLVIIMVVFSVIGITLFREIVPERFNDLSLAMFSLFICVTQDGWMDVFKDFQQHGESYYYGGGLYLIIFISIGAFIFANLVVAVVVTNLECAVKEVRREEEAQNKDNIETKGKLVTDATGEAQVVKGEEIPCEVFESQLPILVPDFENIDITKLENYFLVLSAMEENMVEYQDLRAELVKFFDEVCELNVSAAAEGVFESVDVRRKSEAVNYHKAMQSGDIMSNLMHLEASNLIDSNKTHSITNLLSDTAELGVRYRRDSSSSQTSVSGWRSSLRSPQHKSNSNKKEINKKENEIK